ncbi:MAG: hypothetical protein LBF22_12190, partial [Deltaproteobacteria bacterium]|nr:hypothetical protein [Deltaproteobacteria bacterium]
KKFFNIKETLKFEAYFQKELDDLKIFLVSFLEILILTTRLRLTFKTKDSEKRHLLILSLPYAG